MLLKLGILLLFFLPVVESFNRSLGLYLLYAGAILISFPVLWKKRINVDLIDLLFLSFLTAATISTLFSISFLRSGIELSRYFSYFLIFAALRNNLEENDRIKKYYINSILANSLILTLLFIIYQFFGRFLPPVTLGMNLFYPIFGHNRIADILILLIPLLLILKYPKYILIFFSIMLAVSFGRGAMVSLSAAFIIAFFLTNNKFREVKIGAIAYLFLALIMVGGIFLNTHILSSNKKDRPYYSGLYKPLVYDLRVEYFQQALKGFIVSPILGNGLDTFRYISQKYQSKPVSWSLYTHNHFLQIYSDAGYLGGTIFLMMTAALFWKAYGILIKSSDNYKKGIFMAILASAIHSFIDYDWQYISIFLFVFSGFAILMPIRDEGRSVSGKLLMLIAAVQICIGSLLNLSESDRVFAKSDRLLNEGKVNFALYKLDELERLDRVNKEIYRKKAKIYIGISNFDMARNNFQKVKELNPMDATDFIR